MKMYSTKQIREFLETQFIYYSEEFIEETMQEIQDKKIEYLKIHQRCYFVDEQIEGDFEYVVSNDRIKENTNTVSEGLNGDWCFNTIHKTIFQVGDITNYDWKIIATNNPKLKLPKIPKNVYAISEFWKEIIVEYEFVDNEWKPKINGDNEIILI